MADAGVRVRIQASYADMPNSHKRTFRIGRSPENYREIIDWLRTICCREGGEFNGIPSLNSGGYPFVEIEVVNFKRDSVKFIICKRDLYVFAFTSRSKVISRGKQSDEATKSSGVDNIASSSSKVILKGKRSDEATTSSSRGVGLKGKIAPTNNSGSKTWFLFNLGYLIDDWEVLKSYKGAYTDRTPPKVMGPRCMSDVVCLFNDVNATQASIVRACQVFFVHLSEAARFRPVEYMVYKSLARGAEFERVEENHILVETVSDEKDVYFQIRGRVHPCFSDGDWEVYLDKLVHSWSHLSIIWYTYYFTNKELFEMEDHQQMLSTLYMRYRKSVRFTVAVLCRLNDKKLLPVLKKGGVKGKQYKKIVAKIKRLTAYRVSGHQRQNVFSWR